MRLRDTFRSKRSDDDQAPEAAGLESAAGGAEVAEPTVFAPRSDGFYRATTGTATDPTTEGGIPQEEAPAAGYLRFLGTRVFWAPGSTPRAELDAALAPGPDPWMGDWTPAGRFAVNRRFEQPVVHTVLRSGEDFFVARRTAVAHQDTDVVRYSFVAPTAR